MSSAATAVGKQVGVELNVRVGIATGVEVVGEVIGSGLAAEMPVVGQTPNLAARLQGVAEPGMVVVSESTHRLVEGKFSLRGLGTFRLKGFEEPIAAWSVRTSTTNSHELETVSWKVPDHLFGRCSDVISRPR